MGQVIASTFTTADRYQHYLPFFIYSLKTNYPEILITTFIQGRIDKLNTKAFNYLHGQGLRFDLPIENVFKGIEIRKSTANSLRFLVPESYFRQFEYVFFLDADLMIFKTDPTLLDWHLKRMCKIGSCYAGHHGPWKKRYRPEVSINGWRGRFERVAGGFFMASAKWFKKTKNVRKKYLKQIQKQKYNDTYREADEVMLCRILKESGLPVPVMKRSRANFDIELRGIHFGDFKKQMKHRYESKSRMRRVLTRANCQRYLKLLEDPIYNGLIEIMGEDKQIAEMLPKIENHCKKRTKKL